MYIFRNERERNEHRKYLQDKLSYLKMSEKTARARGELREADRIGYEISHVEELLRYC